MLAMWTTKGWTTKGDRALRVQRLMVVSRETRGGSSDSGGRGTEGERANPERRTYHTTINSELIFATIKKLGCCPFLQSVFTK